jgi:hypothetical protein
MIADAVISTKLGSIYSVFELIKIKRIQSVNDHDGVTLLAILTSFCLEMTAVNRG